MEQNIISAEKAEEKAKFLYKLSCELGAAINDVDNMAKINWQAVVDEADAYESLVIDGEKTIRALRLIALRLDRSVLCKIEDR